MNLIFRFFLLLVSAPFKPGKGPIGYMQSEITRVAN